MIAGARRLLGHSRDEALVAGVRRRDRRAFEAIYERHAAQLLTFCMYLLGSRHDAEDALQATFASAYRALLNDTRPVSLRPWLFTIARNESLSILRKRRPQVELNGEVALTGDPVKLAEVHEEMVSMIGGIRELPEKQRAALVLAEVHGMSHAEIGSVLGVRPAGEGLRLPGPLEPPVRPPRPRSRLPRDPRRAGHQPWAGEQTRPPAPPPAAPATRAAPTPTASSASTARSRRCCRSCRRSRSSTGPSTRPCSCVAATRPTTPTAPRWRAPRWK